MRKFVGKHYPTNTEPLDYIQIAADKCMPFRIPMIEAIRTIPDSYEKRKSVAAIVAYSKATERHIANLEIEMANMEFIMAKLYERNYVLEEETKRCHAKIDTTDAISLSMAEILYKKLQHGK